MRKSFLVEIQNDHNDIVEESIKDAISKSFRQTAWPTTQVKIIPAQIIEEPRLGTFTVVESDSDTLEKCLNEAAFNGHSEIVSHVVDHRALHTVILREAEHG